MDDNIPQRNDDLPEAPSDDDNMEAPAEAEVSEDTDEVETELVTNVSIQRVAKLLQDGDVVEEHGRVRWAANVTTILTIKDEEYQSLAVYKPQAGERPLWDFPDGTLCKREVSAYVVSDAMGWDIVPPTVLRDGPTGLGAIQLYIDHDPQITYFQLSDDFVPDLQRVAIFDYVVNNTDRKGGHLLLDPTTKLWGIDHGICFHHHPKLRTVIWDFAGQEIDSKILQDISEFCNALEDDDSLLVNHLKELISSVELTALKVRVNRLLENKTYPTPGPGPNYPWPAV